MALFLVIVVVVVGTVKVADHLVATCVAYAPAACVPAGLRDARDGELTAWSPVFAGADWLSGRSTGWRRVMNVLVHVLFRAPVLAALQAITLLLFLEPPRGDVSGGVCRLSASPGVPLWLAQWAVLTAVVSIAFAVALLLATIVRERRSGRSPEVKSGLVWIRVARRHDQPARAPRTVDPLLVVPAMTFALVLTFAALFLVLMCSDPQALRVPACRFDPIDALYFSVVTAATVGFGDVSPASRLAELAVVVEIVLAAFGLALFIASVIGQPVAVDLGETPREPPPDAEVSASGI